MVARVLRGTGEVLITAGVVTLLFVAYLLWWTDLQNSRTQDRLSHDLTTRWSAESAKDAARPSGGSSVPVPAAQFTPPRLGAALARLYIPRLGRDYHPVVVEGVGTADLQEGAGHYPRTALPGAPGNSVISGHRTTFGKPFSRLDEVRAGDHVVVETRTAWVTYRVTGEEIVVPTASEVISDTPPAIGDQPAAADRLLTLTTCNPRYSASQRLILRGVWESSDPKATGSVPRALRDGQV